MENLKKVVGENLKDLRINAGLTQLELAEKFNYSDRAISKWENGDTLPDLETLSELCEFYGVTLDYLTHKENKQEYIKATETKEERTNKIIITCMILSIAWMVATIVFVYTLLNKGKYEHPYWLAFVWAVPVTAFLINLFNGAYFKLRPLYFWMWSLFIWSLLTGIYLQVVFYAGENVWPIFLVGIPIQFALAFWANLRKIK